MGEKGLSTGKVGEIFHLDTLARSAVPTNPLNRRGPIGWRRVTGPAHEDMMTTIAIPLYRATNRSRNS